jgi:polysaccharide biosynthesis transport protein
MNATPNTDRAGQHTEPSEGVRTGPGLALYLDALWRARWGLLAGTVLAGVSSWGVSAWMPRQYEATAVVIVAPPKVGQAASGGAPGLEVRNYRSYLENQSLIAQLIRQFKLEAAPHHLTPEQFLDRVLTVSDIRDSRLLEVRVTLRDPKLAADVANDLALRAVELSRTVNQEEVVVARDIIKEQLDAARERLTAARSAYEQGQKAAQVELLDRDVDTLLEQQRDLRIVQVNIERERARLAQAEKELAGMTRVRDVRRAVNSLPVPSSSARPQERTAPPEVRSPKDTEDLGAKAPESRRTARQEDRRPPPREEPAPEPPLSIRDELLDPYVNPVHEYLSQQVATGRTSLASLESEGRVLQQTLRGKSGQFPVLAELYRRQSEVDELEMQQELAEKIYVDVATRYEAARLQVAERSAQMQLLDRALPPERPASPRVAQNVAAAVVVTPSVLVALIVLVAALRRALAQQLV